MREFKFKKKFLGSLDMLAFKKMTDVRSKVIEDASTEPIDVNYSVNRMARAMHPNIQYVQISHITEHCPHTKTYFMVPDRDRGTERLAYFRAGQYISVNLDIGSTKTARAYSLSSSPRDAINGQYSITIKRVDDGFASAYILDNFKIGDRLSISEPMGQFYYEPVRDKKLVLGICGGSGITPIYSMAKAVSEGTLDINMVILYRNRTSNDIILKKELDKLNSDKVKVLYFLSRSQEEGYEHGFISSEVISKYSNGDASLFICGPVGFCNYTEAEAKKLNIDKKYIRREIFSEISDIYIQEGFPEDAKDKNYTLTATIFGEDISVPCKSSESLAVALERAGIRPPTRCRAGSCGVCHSKLVSGNVFIPEATDGRRMADKKFGYIHACMTYPTSDVKIEICIKNEI